MNHMLEDPEDFDHTYWCYVTDYIQGAVFLTIPIIVFFSPCKLQDDRSKLIRLHSYLALASMGLFAIVAATVHQCYLDEDDVILYNLIWEVSTVFGFSAVILTFLVGVLLLNRDFRWFKFLYVLFALDFLAFFLPFFLDVIMIGTFAVVVFLIAMAILQLRFAKSPQMVAFVVLCATGAALCISGAICQLFELKPSRDFNHNSIYHIMMMLGVPLVYLMPMLGLGLHSIGGPSGRTNEDESLV